MVCALPALLWPCRMRCVLTKNKASQFTAWQQFKEIYFFLRFPQFKWSWQIKRVVNTGKSFSEAPILTSTNPQYDKKLFIESPVQYIHENSKIRTCCVHKLFWISKQKQKTICVHNMFWAWNFHVLIWWFKEQSVVILWVSWCKNKSFWQSLTCTKQRGPKSCKAAIQRKTGFSSLQNFPISNKYALKCDRIL